MSGSTPPVLVVVCAAIVAGCGGATSSTAPGLDAAAASEGTADAGFSPRGADGAVESGALPLIFCSSDSDCGNPYLACAPTRLNVCRDPDASPGTEPAALADASVCPSRSWEVLDVCFVRYQLDCDSSASCGPAGFTCGTQGAACSGGACVPLTRCQHQYTLCSSDSDCPAGWSCYSPPEEPPAPPGAAVQRPPMACYPPFAEFN